MPRPHAEVGTCASEATVKRDFSSSQWLRVISALSVTVLSEHGACVQVSVHQACVLLLFNDADTLSFPDISSQTCIPLPELRRTLQSLALGKVRVCLPPAVLPLIFSVLRSVVAFIVAYTCQSCAPVLYDLGGNTVPDIYSVVLANFECFYQRLAAVRRCCAS